MATKTISLELDAYERLRQAKRSSRESFSSVVRRARFDDDPPTVADLLSALDYAARQQSELATEDELDQLQVAQDTPRYTPSKWHDSL
jgi:hypothetical protein